MKEIKMSNQLAKFDAQRKIIEQKIEQKEQKMQDEVNKLQGYIEMCIWEFKWYQEYWKEKPENLLYLIEYRQKHQKNLLKLKRKAMKKHYNVQFNTKLL
jgi:hypothetical protein